MELLTIDETAALLRVSKVTVRRFVSSGRLPAVRVGRSVRIAREDAERLPTRASVQPPQARGLSKPGGVLTKDDPIWELVGIANCGPGDVSENKDKYLAEAYMDLHE